MKETMRGHLHPPVGGTYPLRRKNVKNRPFWHFLDFYPFRNAFCPFNAPSHKHTHTHTPHPYPHTHTHTPHTHPHTPHTHTHTHPPPPTSTHTHPFWYFSFRRHMFCVMHKIDLKCCIQTHAYKHTPKILRVFRYKLRDKTI